MNCLFLRVEMRGKLDDKSEMKHKSYFKEVSEEWSGELEKAGGKNQNVK